MARFSHIHGDSCIATRIWQFEKKKKVELALARKESLILNSSNNLFKKWAYFLRLYSNLKFDVNFYFLDSYFYFILGLKKKSNLTYI